MTAVFTTLLTPLSSSLCAQVPDVTVTESAEVYLRHWYSVYYNALSSGTCNTQDCTLQRTLNTSTHESAASASKTSISGNMRRLNDGWSAYGGDNASYRTRIYAKVPANQNVVIKIPATAGIGWTNMKMVGVPGGWRPIATVWVSASLTGTITTIPASSLGYSSDSSVPDFNDSKSGILSLESRASGFPVDIGGESYYLVGYLTMAAQSTIRPEGSPSPSVSFNASIGQAEVRYKGKVLKYESGGGQTWLTGRSLPEPFSVKVIQDDTGQPVADETVTFTVQEPVNGATLSGVTATTDAEGIARTTLTLGSSPGLYTVKASCPGCVASASTINFTAEAKARETVIKLVKVSGDGAMPAGEKILNPLKVQAFNTLTEAGEPGLNVEFSFVSIPEGGNDAAVGAPLALTNNFGIAQSSLRLGAVEGDYIIKALCDACELNKEVSFTLTGQKLTVAPGASTGETRVRYKPTSIAEEISLLQIAFQNERMSDWFRVLPHGNARIGVLIGDSLKFKGAATSGSSVSIPDSEYAWSGAASGTGIATEVTFNSKGTFEVRLTVKNKTQTAIITVDEIASTTPFHSWLKAQSNLPFSHIVLSCAVSALSWANYYGPAHNDASDAMRHAYWNACITNLISAEVAAGATNAWEYSNLTDSATSSPHNENVMDLENNHIGRIIGADLPYLTGLPLISERVKALAKQGRLTVIDRPSNNHGSGVLIPSVLE